MKTLEDKIQELCKEFDIPEPMEFLTKVMAGHDPRHLSDVYKMVLKLEEEHGEGELPDEFQYLYLTDRIKERYQFFPVPLGESHAAAKQIIEYTHSKKKQVEHSGSIGEGEAIQPLTRKEIRMFQRRFNKEY